MSEFKTVLVVGGLGGLGKFVVDEFVANGNYNVKIFTRPSSLAEKAADIEKYKAVGVEVVSADYSDHAGLVKALKGVDVVISTLGFPFFYDIQIALIKASEEAGVKRFIPSDFGTDTRNLSTPFFEQKSRIAEHLRTKSTLEYTLFYTGYFLDTFFSFNRWDLDTGKAVIIGNGNDRFNLTHRKDIAQFVVASLSNPKSRNAAHGTASDIVSWNEVLAIAEKYAGKKFDVTYKDLASVEAEIAAAEGLTEDFALNTILSLPAQGLGVIEQSVAVDYPHIKVTTVDQFLREYYSKA